MRQFPHEEHHFEPGLSDQELRDWADKTFPPTTVARNESRSLERSGKKRAKKSEPRLDFPEVPRLADDTDEEEAEWQEWLAGWEAAEEEKAGYRSSPFSPHGYSQTPCQQEPDLCLPRAIKQVVWDGDDTMWDLEGCSIASEMVPPLTKISRDSVASTITSTFIKNGKPVTHTKECVLTLKPGMLETLDELDRMGISSSIASQNTLKPVVDVLTALGILDRFKVIEADWNAKSVMMDNIIKKTKIDPFDTIFIDDGLGNLHDVLEYGDILPLNMGFDIKFPAEVLEYIKR